MFEKGDNDGRSKREAEQLVAAASRGGALSTITLNPANIIGPGDVANWSKQLILPVAADRLRVIPPGSATWISVHDVIDAHVAAVAAPLDGGNVIRGGVEASFLEVVQTIASLVGRQIPRRATSPSVLRGLFALSMLKSVITRT